MGLEINRRAILSKTLRKSLFNKNLSVKINCNDRELEIYDVKTFFGLFSIGDKRVNIPLRSIASFATERKINWLRSIFVIIVPFVLNAIWYTMFDSYFFAPLVLLSPIIAIALLFIKDSYLVIYDNGGVKHNISVWFWDKNEILYLVKEINEVVSGD